MQTRFPQCEECRNPIDPMKDAFKITNPDEAKYGVRPDYAHEVCPALVAEDELEEGLELEKDARLGQFSDDKELVDDTAREER